MVDIEAQGTLPQIVLEQPTPDMVITHAIPATRPLVAATAAAPAPPPSAPLSRRQALFSAEEVQGIAAEDDDTWRRLQSERVRLQRQVGEDASEADQLAFMISDIKLMLDLFGMSCLCREPRLDAFHPLDANSPPTLTIPQPPSHVPSPDQET